MAGQFFPRRLEIGFRQGRRSQSGLIVDVTETIGRSACAPEPDVAQSQNDTGRGGAGCIATQRLNFIVCKCQMVSCEFLCVPGKGGSLQAAQNMKRCAATFQLKITELRDGACAVAGVELRA